MSSDKFKTKRRNLLTEEKLFTSFKLGFEISNHRRILALKCKKHSESNQMNAIKIHERSLKIMKKRKPNKISTKL